MLDRDYEKRCDVQRLVVELVAAGLALDSRFFGASCTEDVTTVYVADDFTTEEGDICDTVVSNHDDTPLPSPQEEYATSLDESQTNSQKMTDKIVLTTQVYPPGDYMIEWSVEARSSKNSNQASIKVSVDDGEVLCDGGVDNKQWGLCSGFNKITTTEYQTITVRLQFCSETGGNVAAYVRRASLRIKPTEV